MRTLYDDRRVQVIWWTLVALIALAGVTLRFWGLDTQSYWTDENFEVLAASKSWDGMWHTIGTEIHTPTYVLLLRLWINLGGPGPIAVRSLSALFSALGVLVSYLGLRKSGLSQFSRSLIVVVTACSGFAIVYAQEARPYSMLWFTAVGLSTAAISYFLRLASDERFPTALLIWGVAASAVHMFGSICLGAFAVALLVARRSVRNAIKLGLSALLGALPQLLWLGYGFTQPDFASRSSFLGAPTFNSLKQLLTTVFAFDHLGFTGNGFEWKSKILVGACGVLLLLAMPCCALSRTSFWTNKALQTATLLLTTGVALILVVYLISDWVHLWTLRNMIIVAPLLVWGWVLLLDGLVRPGEQLRQTKILSLVRVVISVAVVGIFVFAMICVGREMTTSKYKSDYGQAMEYLAKVREDAPNAKFFLSTKTPATWMLSAKLPQDQQYLEWLLGDATLEAKEDFTNVARPVPGRAVYVWYRSTHFKRVKAHNNQLLAIIGEQGCQVIPVFGISVVDCNR